MVEHKGGMAGSNQVVMRCQQLEVGKTFMKNY